MLKVRLCIDTIVKAYKLYLDSSPFRIANCSLSVWVAI